MSEQVTPEERAARRAELQRRYRRRRATALAVVVGGLVAAGALLAGFVFGGSSGPAADAPAVGTSTVCEPSGSPTTVKPGWWTRRRQTVLVDSVLLGATQALRQQFRRWHVEIVGKPAIMLPAMEERIAARRKVARLVVIGIGYNSLWERGRRNYSQWASKFDSEAKELLATLRRKGARQFVWVTLRNARRSVIPPSAYWQHDRYAWYFKYVNERLRRLDRRRGDLVVAPWDKVSNRRGLTYDAIHLNPAGAALMAQTIQKAIQAEGKRQTKVVPPPPGDCA
jgi:lysophospholipase L1-like esterase